MLDVLGKSKDTDKENGSAGGEDGRRSTLLRADLEVWVVVANAACSSPLLLGSDGVVLWGRGNVNESRAKRTVMDEPTSSL